MIIADPMPVFPKCPGLGFTGQPDYLVKIVERDGGWERRDRKWARALRRYTGVPVRDRIEGDIQDVLYFWHAMGGREKAFRFRDYADYKSCKTHQTPAAADSPFVELIAGEVFQLVKVYSAGAIEQVREITRPDSATIVLYNELNEPIDPVWYELDASTGIVTITTTGFPGVLTSWSGLFDLKCRFDSDLPITVEGPIQDLNIAIKELREDE